MEPPLACGPVLIDRYARLLEDQYRLRGVNPGWVKRVQLAVRFGVPIATSERPYGVRGEGVEVIVEIEDDLGRTRIARETSCCAPHDPAREARSARFPDSPPAFRFRPLGEPHLRLLRKWLLRPHVAAWWDRDWTVAKLREHYLERVDEPRATRAWIAEHGPEFVGFIQRYWVMGSGEGWWEDETDPGAVGIDLFLADGHRLGQGLGSAMIRAFLEMLFEDGSVTVVQTDPAPGNARAIAAYRKAGFREGGVVATPDGPALLLRCDRASFTATRPGPPGRLR
ncbi:MAG: GNAT family N-acetyltransferase [Betaproteobacteria bacterium]|nr:GNAT family N-acetyltransferase [Betaproteobacteria bacterium]